MWVVTTAILVLQNTVHWPIKVSVVSLWNWQKIHGTITQMRRTKFVMHKQQGCKYQPITFHVTLLKNQRVRKLDSILQLHNVWVCQRIPSWSMILRMPRCSQTLTVTPKLGRMKCAKTATIIWCFTPVPAGWMKITFARKGQSTPLNLAFKISGLPNILLRDYLLKMLRVCVTTAKQGLGNSLLKQNCFQGNISLTTV